MKNYLLLLGLQLTPSFIWNIFWKKYFSFAVGKNVTFNGNIVWKVQGKLEIGTETKINSGPFFNTIGGQQYSSIVVLDEAKLYIGRNVGMSNTSIFCRQEIWVGDNVRIGGSCKIYDSDFHSLQLEQRLLVNDPDIKTKKVTILDGAFIGAHTIILKGVVIGEKAVIGAGSVVTKSIPRNEIWAGNPAKKIGEIE